MSEKTNYFWQGCPLWIDREGEGLRLRNTGWREITSVSLLADGVTYEYTTPIAPGDIVLWQISADTYQPVRVCFADGVEWINDSETIVIGAPELPDAEGEYYAAFAEAWKDTAPLYQPEKNENYWRCGCGQVNDIARTYCANCNKDRQWVYDHLDGASVMDTRKAQAEKELQIQKLALEQESARQGKKKKWIRLGALAGALVAVVCVIVCLIAFVFVPGRHYAVASAYMELDYFYDAYTEYEKANGYRDSEEKMLEISHRLSSETSISAGYRHVVKNNRQGKAEGVGYALDTQLMVDKWNAIRAVSCGKDHTLGLHYSGTVIAVGKKKTGALDVKNWLNMVAIGAGDQFSVGLQNDGKLLAVGKNNKGQCNVKNWTDVTAIAVGEDFTLGLKSDGTVIATGNNDAGQCNVSEWTDIVFIAAGNSHALGIKSDGTVVATGSDKNKECETSEWKDIIAVAAGDGFTVGLKEDGTLVATGKNDRGQIKVEEYSDIIGVTCGWDFTIVIDGNGTPHYVGTDADGESKIYNWTIGV